jgi:hypothetical protein|tara:strand:- start:35 stop:295 length:261 start_codon:yes stop_codon:yes gene_type:complete
MSIKEKRTFEEEKKNGMNVVTNMNGEKKANEKLEVADVSDKMTIPQVREYIRLYKTGGDVNKYLRQFKLLKPELDELQKLAARRTS